MDLNARLGDATRCLLSVNAAIVGSRSSSNDLGHFTEFTVQHQGKQFRLYGLENRDYLEFLIHCRLSNLFYGRISDEEVKREISESERSVADDKTLWTDTMEQFASKRVAQLDEGERKAAFRKLREHLSQQPTDFEFLTVSVNGDDTLDGVSLRRRIYPSENRIEVAGFGGTIDGFANDYERVDTILTEFSAFDKAEEDVESATVESVESSGIDNRSESIAFQ